MKRCLSCWYVGVGCNQAEEELKAEMLEPSLICRTYEEWGKAFGAGIKFSIANCVEPHFYTPQTLTARFSP